MNYTNNVPCHTMKPLERKLFKMMLRRIDYASVKDDSGIVEFIMPSNIIIEDFVSKYGVSQKMALYYLEKWKQNGIYNSGRIYGCLQYGHFIKMNLLVGLENLESKLNESKKQKYSQYIEAVPYRVKRQYLRALSKISPNYLSKTPVKF